MRSLARLAVLLLATQAAAACARSSAFRAEPVGATVRIGVARRPDSTQRFMDSLATARDADRAVDRNADRNAERNVGRDPGRSSAQGATPPAVRVDALTDLAWLDVLKDTVLTAMVRTAVSQNRDVAIARARIQEYRAMAGIARAPFYPRVGTSASVATNQAVFGKSPPIQFDAWRATADVAWELDFWGRTRRGVDAANAELAAQEAGERAIVLSLVSDVALGYLQLLELDEEHDIATRTLASRRSTLSLVQDRYARGVVSELDVRQFEALLAIPVAHLAQVERQQAQQEHALSVLLGQSPMGMRRGGSLVAAARTLVVPDSLPATLLDRRPDVAQAERVFAATSARAGEVWAARMPSLSINGFYGTQASTINRAFASNTGVYQLQAGISVPLYSGGRDKNEVAAARARVDQAKAAYEKTGLTALREASDALVAARTARDEVTAYETQVGALQRALELSQLRYDSGVSTFLEVLDAQRGLFDAELVLAQSRLRQLSAGVQLYKAFGGSWNEGISR